MEAQAAAPGGVVAPFVKWAGGKRQLVPLLRERMRGAQWTGAYFEPFLGGGALFFALRAEGPLPPRSVLSDLNPHLVEAWCAIRDDLQPLLDGLREHASKHNEQWYYDVRAQVPDDAIARAARVIYLNRTCFNGLYRENSKGQFNVPFGRYENPAIHDPERLRAAHRALQGVDVRHARFSDVARWAHAGDFVYFDPPYEPLSRSSQFRAYTGSGFDTPEQDELAALFATLAERGVNVMLSNSWTEANQRRYAAFGPEAVDARRSVNRDPTKRGAISELLVCGWSRMVG